MKGLCIFRLLSSYPKLIHVNQLANDIKKTPVLQKNILPAVHASGTKNFPLKYKSIPGFPTNYKRNFKIYKSLSYFSSQKSYYQISPVIKTIFKLINFYQENFLHWHIHINRY